MISLATVLNTEVAVDQIINTVIMLGKMGMLMEYRSRCHLLLCILSKINY